MTTCNTCNKTEHLFFCPCTSVAYCDKDCQKSNWKDHKPICETIRSEFNVILTSGLIEKSKCDFCSKDIDSSNQIENRCCGCMHARYCNTECQINDRSKHKHICKAVGKYKFKFFTELYEKEHNKLLIYYIARFYRYGTGTKQNIAKAIEWYELGSANGDVYCMASIAKIYLNGETVEKNYQKAIEWFHRAADAGHSQVQYELSRMYVFGEYITPNRDIALKYLNMAINSGNKDAILLKNSIGVYKLIKNQIEDMRGIVGDSIIDTFNNQKFILDFLIGSN